METKKISWKWRMDNKNRKKQKSQQYTSNFD